MDQGTGRERAFAPLPVSQHSQLACVQYLCVDEDSSPTTFRSRHGLGAGEARTLIEKVTPTLLLRRRAAEADTSEETETALIGVYTIQSRTANA